MITVISQLDIVEQQIITIYNKMIFYVIISLLYLVKSFIFPMRIYRTKLVGYSVMFSSENSMKYA